MAKVTHAVCEEHQHLAKKWRTVVWLSAGIATLIDSGLPRAWGLSLLPLPRDHHNFGDLAGNPGGACKHGGSGESWGSGPAWESEEVEGMSFSGFVIALFRRVMVAELTHNDGARCGSFSGGTRLPVETEALAADGTVKVLSKFGSSE